MLRHVATILVVLALSSPAHAETIDLRQRSETNRSEEISFCARPSPNGFGFPGHAFVAFSHVEGGGRTFLALGRTTNAGAPSAIRSYFGRATSGLISQENYSHVRQDCLTVLVSPGDYERARSAARPRLAALGLPNETTQRLESYSLGSNDCLTFIIDVAATLAGSGLMLPERSRADLPLDYIEKLRAENRR